MKMVFFLATSNFLTAGIYSNLFSGPFLAKKCSIRVTTASFTFCQPNERKGEKFSGIEFNRKWRRSQSLDNQFDRVITQEPV